MKQKFALKTKIGQIVYEINVNYVRPGEKPCSIYPHGITVEKLKIVHQTERRIALSDSYITIMDRIKKGERKESYNRCLNDITVNVKTKETYFPNGIFSKCYTTIQPEECIKDMKLKIYHTIKKEYGFLFDDSAMNDIQNFEIKYI